MEFAVETTLSVGLPGRSKVDVMEGVVGIAAEGYGIAADTTDAGGDGIVEGAETRGELGVGIGDIMPFGSLGEWEWPCP